MSLYTPSHPQKQTRHLFLDPVLYAAAMIVLVPAIRAMTISQIPAALVTAVVTAILDRFPIYLNPIGELPITAVITIPTLVLFGWPAAIIGAAGAMALTLLLSSSPGEAVNRGLERLPALGAAAAVSQMIQFPAPTGEVAQVVLAIFALTVIRTLVVSLRMHLEETIALSRALRYLAVTTSSHMLVQTAVAAAAVWTITSSTSTTDRLLGPVLGAAVTLQLYLPRILRGQEERRVLAAVSVLAAAVDAKDAYTADHSATVARLSQRVARHLGLQELEVHRVYLAALLHDVGKTIVPPELLGKPAALTPQERDAVRSHVDAGVRIVETIKGLAGIAPLIAASHECWDGSGYPHGLKEEEIPLGARILHVVDAFNAITTDRPYRPGRSPGTALRELDAHSGTQFDPRVVAALRAVLGLPRPRTELAGSPAWLSLLRHPAFGLLWMGEFVSFIGDTIFFVAITLWVLKLTGSATMLALTLIAAPIGQALLGFLAGALADRMDRRSLIITTDIGRAALVAALPFVLPWSLPGALGLLLVLNIGTVFFRTGIFALIPSVVPRDELLTANALFQTTQRIAEVMGGVLGGAIVLAVGYQTAFYLDAGSFLVSAVCVAMMPVAWRAGLSTAVPRKISVEIAEGLRYIWQTPIHRILALLIFPGYLTLAFDALQTPMVVKTAGLSAMAYGVINSAVGVGKLLSATVLTGTGKQWVTVPFTVVMFLVTALACTLFGSTTLYPTLIAAAFLFGLGNISTNIANATLSLANAPSGISGRLMASRQVFVAATTVLGMLVFGRLADVTNPQIALGTLGATSAAGILAVWFVAGRQLHMEAPAGASEAAAGGEAD
jgi:putative nucleotidyltransferase with HDIG domain